MQLSWQGDEMAMQQLAKTLARHQPWPLCVHLAGDLGAGKTTLARAWLRALGHQGAVRSPTYTLVEAYELASKRVFHLDLYRLADAEELDYLGRDDWAGEDVLLLIEWPQRGAELTPSADVVIDLQARQQGQQRRLHLSTNSPRGEAYMAALQAQGECLSRH
jgi:tRNA threonylcarbamoyladenosine biosynthesis protein TsaE